MYPYYIKIVSGRWDISANTGCNEGLFWGDNFVLDSESTPATNVTILSEEI